MEVSAELYSPFPETQRVGGWVELRASADTLRKMSFLCRQSGHVFPVVQPPPRLVSIRATLSRPSNLEV